jgi:sialate O-acetylesterase
MMQKTILILMAMVSLSSAKIKVASVFSDHMVLQRGKPVPVWGTAKPGEKLLVEFAGQTKWCTTDAEGKWLVKLDPLTVNAEPQDLWVVSSLSDEKRKLSDLLVGDVWLCGGQSNMAWGLGGTLEGQTIIESANHPNLRLLKIPKRILKEPAEQFDAKWGAATSATAGGFSAVGYIFGQCVHLEAGVPIGLIMCAVGSTSVECWVSNETLKSDLFAPAITKWAEVEAQWDDPAVREKYIHKSEKHPDTVKPWDARTYPGGCFNGMLNTLFPFSCKGVVWYQGEANRTRGVQYRDLFPAMVSEWRDRFAQDDLSFYIVQLPGERLAKIALAKNYGKDVEYKGPTYKSIKVKGGKALIAFDHVGDGLQVAKRTGPTSIEVEPVDEPLANFAVAGADKVFHAADAVIKGNTVIISSDAVKKPVAVRYAWSDSPVGCNLYNAAGLPAAPFRTDDWPCLSENALEGKVLIVR